MKDFLTGWNVSLAAYDLDFGNNLSGIFFTAKQFFSLLYVFCQQISFNGYFPGQSGQAGTRMSPFWSFTGAKDEGGGRWWQRLYWRCKTCSLKLRSDHITASIYRHATVLQAGCHSSCRTKCYNMQWRN